MADPTFDHVFAFITETASLTLECHAFLCPKKKIARAATLTIAQGFSLAYQAWQSAHMQQSREFRRQVKQEEKVEHTTAPMTIQVQVEPTVVDANNLIDFIKESESPKQEEFFDFTSNKVGQWENFDDIKSVPFGAFAYSPGSDIEFNASPMDNPRYRVTQKKVAHFVTAISQVFLGVSSKSR